MTTETPAVQTPPPPPPPPPQPPALPEARTRRSRWVGIVWAVPIAALIIVAFLGVRSLAGRGIDVVVTFDSGAGARVDDTKVIYQGLEAGSVTKVEINPDGHRVDMTLRLDPRSERGLTTTTKFWLVGATPNLNDLSSVKAAVAGVTIGVAPGIGGTPTRRFIGLSEPPIVLPGTPGRGFVLESTQLGTARIGSSIYFRGQEVGKLTATRFAAPDSFQLDFFVFAPYDRLIRADSIFWVSSPVRVSLTDTGASANIEHAGALINGAVEVDRLGGDDATSASAEGSRFALYQSRSEAEAGPVGPQVPYAFTFSGPAGDLSVGAPVRLLGFQVGAVRSVRMLVDARSGALSTAVVAAIYPRRLQVAGPASASASASAASASASASAANGAGAGGGGAGDAEVWGAATDAVLNRLLARGHRAQLVQKPPVIGGRIITLDRVAGAEPASLGAAPAAGMPRTVPSIDATGGIDELTKQTGQILAKVNQIPFDAIGRNVQALTGNLSRLVASPQLTRSLQRVDSALGQLDAMLQEVRPQVGPLVGKLDRAADELTGTVAAARGVIAGNGAGVAPDASLPDALRELTDAARSLRSLADYLGRHPESLIRGRGGDAGPDTRKEPR